MTPDDPTATDPDLEDVDDPGHDPEVVAPGQTRRRVPAGHAILIVLTTFAITLFLDADGLVQTAERQPPGWQRTTALAVMHPIQDVSGALRLNRPRKWLAAATGRTRDTTITPTDHVVIATSVPGRTHGHPPGTPTTTTTLPPLRVASADDPLRLLVVGDSLAGHLGPSLADHLADRPVKVTLDDHVGTGLARPDVVDWPRELTYQMDQVKPDVVVLIFGGNDNQDLRTASGWVRLSDYQAWKEEYQRRIAQLMDIVARPGVTVWWIGLPVMNRPKLQKVVPDINKMLQLEAAARPGRVFFVDSDKALATADGSYRVFAPTPGGGQVQIRENDGVHPTRAGVDRIVELFLPQLIELRLLDTPPPTTTTTVAARPRVSDGEVRPAATRPDTIP